MIIKSELLTTQEVLANAARLSGINLLSYSTEASALANHMKSINHCDAMESSSPSSALSAAMSAASFEKRVLVITQKPDMAALKEISSARLPVLIFALSHPEDIMAVREAGAMIIFCDSHQELLDAIIVSFRLAEDSKVLLPVVIVWNGPLTYSEPVIMPSEGIIKNFLPNLKLPHRLEVKKPTHLGIINDYSKTRQQQENAMEIASKNLSILNEQWKKKFKRSWPAAEPYQIDDADMILVTYGYHSSTGRAVVDKLRAAGKKAGLVRIRIFRPFPEKELSFLKEKKVAVLDFASSPGSNSPLFQEIRPLAKFCLNFISLDKYLSEKDFEEIFAKLEKSEKETVFWV